MKDTTKKLLDRVDANHDWDQGQPWSTGGTTLSLIDTCRVCGLHRNWFSDRQHEISDRYTFSTSDGVAVTLRSAAEIECC